MMKWKKKERWSRLYYIICTFPALYCSYHCKPEDIIHNFNFHSDSGLSFHKLLNHKNYVIWGPIAHHPRLQYWEAVNIREFSLSTIKSILRNLSYFNPFLLLNYIFVDVILFSSGYNLPWPFYLRSIFLSKKSLFISQIDHSLCKSSVDYPLMAQSNF